MRTFDNHRIKKTTLDGRIPAVPGFSEHLNGAEGGTRTHTVSLPTDFESVTSANSITSAQSGAFSSHTTDIIIAYSGA